MLGKISFTIGLIKIYENVLWDGFKGFLGNRYILRFLLFFPLVFLEGFCMVLPAFFC